MSTRVTDLLIDLSRDPFKSEEFRTDPARFLDRNQFDSAEMELLAGRSSEAIDIYVAGQKHSPAKKKKVQGPSKKKAKKKKVQGK